MRHTTRLNQAFDPLVVRQQLSAQSARRLSFGEVPARLWEVEDVETARWTYLQGLGFVHFLNARFYRFRLVLLLDAIARERSLSKAFEMTYGRSLEALENLWWAEVLGPAAEAR